MQQHFADVFKKIASTRKAPYFCAARSAYKRLCTDGLQDSRNTHPRGRAPFFCWGKRQQKTLHRWPPHSRNTLQPGRSPYLSEARSAYRRLCTDGIQTREIYFHDVGPRIFRSEKRLQKTLRRWPPDSRNTLPPGRPPFFSAATALPAIAFVPSLQRQRFQQLQSCRRCSNNASRNCNRAAAAATALPGIAIVPSLQRQRFQQLQSCCRSSDSASRMVRVFEKYAILSEKSHKCNSRAVPGEP